jgi:amino acid transporter
MATEQDIFHQLREGLRRHFAPRRHSALLTAIVVAFAVRPLIGDSSASEGVFSAAIVVLMLVALYNINIDEMVGERNRLLAQSRRRLRLGWVLAAAAVVERVLVLFVYSSILNIFGSLCWLLFFAFVTLSELRSILRQREVTGETISMAVSIYLLLGITWMFVYSILFQLNSGAFGGLALPKSSQRDLIGHLFPTLVYFSLTTLSTIGFGDIVPLTLQARYAAVAEGIVGQFYLAILVARLVGLQMSRPTSQSVEIERRAIND